MSKWTVVDKESGIAFNIQKGENGKYFLDCTYNNLKVDIRNYDFNIKGLVSLQLLINSVLADVKPKKRKAKK